MSTEIREIPATVDLVRGRVDAHVKDLSERVKEMSQLVVDNPNAKNPITTIPYETAQDMLETLRACEELLAIAVNS